LGVALRWLGCGWSLGFGHGRRSRGVVEADRRGRVCTTAGTLEHAGPARDLKAAEEDDADAGCKREGALEVLLARRRDRDRADDDRGDAAHHRDPVAVDERGDVAIEGRRAGARNMQRERDRADHAAGAREAPPWWPVRVRRHRDLREAARTN